MDFIKVDGIYINPHHIVSIHFDADSRCKITTDGQGHLLGAMIASDEEAKAIQEYLNGESVVAPKPAAPIKLGKVQGL